VCRNQAPLDVSTQFTKSLDTRTAYPLPRQNTLMALKTLEEMGFTNRQRNLELLYKTDGDVDATIKILKFEKL